MNKTAIFDQESALLISSGYLIFLPINVHEMNIDLNLANSNYWLCPTLLSIADKFDPIFA